MNVQTEQQMNDSTERVNTKTETPVRIWIDFRDNPASGLWRVYTAPNAFAETEYVLVPKESHDGEVKVDTRTVKYCNHLKSGQAQPHTRYVDGPYDLIVCQSCAAAELK